MLFEFPNLASTSVSLRGIFWLYASKDGSSASLAELLDLVVLLKKYSLFSLLARSNNFFPMLFQQKVLTLVLYISPKWQVISRSARTSSNDYV